MLQARGVANSDLQNIALLLLEWAARARQQSAVRLARKGRLSQHVLAQAELSGRIRTRTLSRRSH
jgi:hypothetical protein